MQTVLPCTLMRGGTSKGLYFLAENLPVEGATRDAVLKAAMGSPDARQVDGMGGAHPLTSKVAIVSKSASPDADVDYLFQQVFVDQDRVDGTQNCGNILAGVGPFAIEEGLVAAKDGITPVRIRMVNSGSIAIAHVPTKNGAVIYSGNARIDGVPGTAAPLPIDFLDVAGSVCGSLLPTGNPLDSVEGIDVTCIDNGMPVVVMRASDFGKTGYETPAELEADSSLKEKVEAIRLALGSIMNLGDVSEKTVPKMCLVAPPRDGGNISTRTFIPHRVHEAIGVFGAVSVATACMLPGTVAADVASIGNATDTNSLEVEHPTGFFTVEIDATSGNGKVTITRSALLRTARKLMRGEVYIPAHVWNGQ